MKKHMVIFLVAVLIVVALLASTVLFTVDGNRDIVLIKTFNSVGEPIWGNQGDNAGLHTKLPWPIQKVVRYDSRQMVLEDPLQEVITSDKQNILVTMYCAWKIDKPLEFYRSVQNETQAQERLQARLRSIKADVIARRSMSDMINTDPGRMHLQQVEDEVRAELTKQAQAYGIQITQLGIKQLGLSPRISEAVIQSQIKEREQEAQMYQSAGDAHAVAIVERSRAASDLIREFAKRNANAIATEGARDAAGYYAAFHKNEKLSMYLRLLESIKTSLSQRTEILLDSSSANWVPLPPSMESLGLPAAAPKPAPAAAAAPVK